MRFRDAADLSAQLSCIRRLLAPDFIPPPCSVTIASDNQLRYAERRVSVVATAPVSGGDCRAACLRDTDWRRQTAELGDRSGSLVVRVICPEQQLRRWQLCQCGPHRRIVSAGGCIVMQSPEFVVDLLRRDLVEIFSKIPVGHRAEYRTGRAFPAGSGSALSTRHSFCAPSAVVPALRGTRQSSQARIAPPSLARSH